MTHPWEDPRVTAGLGRQWAAREEALAAGARGIGWKVGFGAPASLETMEIEAPLLGYLTDRTLVDSGSTVSVRGWARGIVEFEVAVYMATDLVGDVGPDQAREAVAALGPAIELADVDGPVEAGAVDEIVAGNIFHRSVILGRPDTGRAGLDISGLTAHILVDDVEKARATRLEDLTGSYPDIVATVANTLAARGERLAAGDVIITGSVIPPIPVQEGQHFTFVLDPFPPIEIIVEA